MFRLSALAEYGIETLAQGEPVGLEMGTSGGIQCYIRSTALGDATPFDWTNYYFTSRAHLAKATSAGARLSVKTFLGTDPHSLVPPGPPSEDILLGSPVKSTNALSEEASLPTIASESEGLRPITTNFYVNTLSTQRWYLVTRGRKVGVFQGVHKAKPLIDGVNNAAWCKVASKEEGQQKFYEALHAGDVYEHHSDGSVVKILPCVCEDEASADEVGAEGVSRTQSEELCGAIAEREGTPEGDKGVAQD
jgi:hypothetical protein